MAGRTSRTISLPADLEGLILKLVASGRYVTASEVVRAALRLLEDQERQAHESATRSERSTMAAG